MSEDCLTASLRGDENNHKQNTDITSGPGPSGMQNFTTRRTSIDSSNVRNSRSYRICKLMGSSFGESAIGGLSINASGKSFPIGIKMGVKDRRASGFVSCNSSKNKSDDRSQTT